MAPKTDKNAQPGASERPARGLRNRNPLVYFGTIVLLVITVVAFVFVPSISRSGGGGDQEYVFGSWNGKPIGYAPGGYFAEQVQEVKTQLEQQGYNDTGDQFFAYQVWRRAFENTVVHYALLDMAADQDVIVTDDFLDREMTKSPAFVEDGTFSRRKYREASSAYKVAIRQDIRDSSVKNRYVQDMVSAIPSTAETAFIKAMVQEERAVEYVAFAFTNYPDAERVAYARANADSFRRVKLSRITLTSSAREAGEVRDRVLSGALTFEDAAKNHSKDAYASKGGDMGWRYSWELKSDFADPSTLEAILALGKGETSPVYETVAGSWVFFRIDETVVPADFASADLVRTVTEYLNRYEKGLVEDWAVAQAQAFADSARTDFATAAVGRSLAVKQTPPFPLNYDGAFNLGYFALFGTMETTDTPELTGADKNETFLRTVFSLKAGDVSEPLVLNDYAIVLRVKEIKAADAATVDLIDAYYPGVLQDALSREFVAGIMKDDRLKDEFIATFSRVFAPAQ